jgi:hypothetical protein
MDETINITVYRDRETVAATLFYRDGTSFTTSDEYRGSAELFGVVRGLVSRLEHDATNKDPSYKRMR